MPYCEGRFHLYSDMSKFAAGHVLYQIQNGKLRLIAYASKRLPVAVRSYSITELELCGLAINIATSSHLLKKVEFNVIVDHLALTHIIKSKAEPATNRIKMLLELICLYSFNLYYMKGKDMILNKFLSRKTHDDSDPHDIIPISFNMHKALYEMIWQGGCPTADIGQCELAIRLWDDQCVQKGHRTICLVFSTVNCMPSSMELMCLRNSSLCVDLMTKNFHQQIFSTDLRGVL